MLKQIILHIPWFDTGCLVNPIIRNCTLKSFNLITVIKVQNLADDKKAVLQILISWYTKLSAVFSIHIYFKVVNLALSNMHIY